MQRTTPMSAVQLMERRRELCRQLIAERKLVGAQLGFDLCPAPTWDMLLDLYLAHHEGRKTYLWSLCMAAHVPTSSAHRKITELVKKGLLTRSADGDDGRRVSVGLTGQCLARLHELFDRISLQIESDDGSDQQCRKSG
jgi:DNA-binding MarR family transcriptional regulator